MRITSTWCCAIYYDASQSLPEAVRLYEEIYGVHVNPRTILGAEQKFRDWGLFMPQGDAGRPRLPPRREEDILDFFDRHPMSSTRDAASVFRMSQNYVWDVLNREGMHPFHFTRVQELQPQDYLPRVEFCQWLRRSMRRNKVVIFNNVCK